MQRGSWIGAGLGLVLAVVLSASAGAQNLDLDEMAAALALPVITGGQAPNPITASRGEVVIPNESAVTLATITNASSSAVMLFVDVISGDPPGPSGGDTWQSDSFDCMLTGRETTTFLFVPSGNESLVYVECSSAFGLPMDVVRSVKAQNGILWVAVADPVTRQALGSNKIFGDAVIADFALGQAYSFGAIPFQAGQGVNSGDKIFEFDGNEYSRWPSAVATNFLAPVAGAINAELILFTLDGATGNPTLPRVAMGGVGYNDDEAYFDFQHEFDCFDIVALDDLTLNFTNDLLGSLSGHLQLVSQPISTPNDSHDAQFGDANSVRRRPFHGWIVQSVLPAQVLVSAGQPTTNQPNTVVNWGLGPGAWGRTLAQSNTALVPFLADDDPVLDADPLL